MNASPSQERPARDEAAERERLAQRLHELADSLLDSGADRGDLKLLVRSMSELCDAFSVLAHLRHHPKVTVFGSARTRRDDPIFQQAVDFGKAIADQGYYVITGAGPGIMEAAHVGATRPWSIGLNILLPFEQKANPVVDGDSKLINSHYFFTRKLLFLKETHAIVLFPGGFGTMDEAFESLTMIQTGKSQMMPIIFIDPPGCTYWSDCIRYIRDELYNRGMISEEDFSLFIHTHSVEEAVNEITTFYRVYHSHRFVRGRLVLRFRKDISDELFDKIQSEYSDILTKGEFRRGDAHHHEANEPHLEDFPRLFFYFNRQSHGRLRQLINLVNREA